MKQESIKAVTYVLSSENMHWWFPLTSLEEAIKFYKIELKIDREATLRMFEIEYNPNDINEFSELRGICNIPIIK